MPRYIFISLLLFSLLSGCSKTIPDLKGSLVGYIRSLDEFARFNNDDEGFEVIAKGETFHTARTDKDGRFEFSELPSGTYQLSIYKEGYGMMKAFSIQHFGGAPTILNAGSGKIERFYVYRIPTATIEDVSIRNDSIVMHFNFKDDIPDRMRVRFTFSEIPGFGDPEIRRTLNYTVFRVADDYRCYFSRAGFSFSPGQQVYMRACIFNIQSTGISYYYDPVLNRTIYPNMGEEFGELSFIYP